MSHMPAFQVDGKFDQATPSRSAGPGRSIAEIESLFRRDAQLRQLDLALDASSS